MSAVMTQLAELYPAGLHGVRVAIDNCSDAARALAVKLFEAGATVVAASEHPNDLGLLNRILFERSGSINRYRPVSYSTIGREKVDVMISLRGTVNEFAKHSIQPGAKPAKSDDGSGGTAGDAPPP
jgi:glutamate dehydrogenase/leucine dehydrogenase